MIKLVVLHLLLLDMLLTFLQALIKNAVAFTMMKDGKNDYMASLIQANLLTRLRYPDHLSRPGARVFGRQRPLQPRGALDLAVLDLQAHAHLDRKPESDPQPGHIR